RQVVPAHAMPRKVLHVHMRHVGEREIDEEERDQYEMTICGRRVHSRCVVPIHSIDEGSEKPAIGIEQGDDPCSKDRGKQTEVEDRRARGESFEPGIKNPRGQQSETADSAERACGNVPGKDSMQQKRSSENKMSADR